MKRIALALLLALALACAKQKPVYEYKTLDSTNEPRLQTLDGRNQVMGEMVKDGWQLQDPKTAGYGRMVWMREVKK